MAALIANQVWSRRVFADRLSLKGSKDERLLRALGAIRKGIEGFESSLPMVMVLGRMRLFVRSYLVPEYNMFPIVFKEISGLSLDEYYSCLCAHLSQYVYIVPGGENSGIFNSITVTSRVPLLKDIFSKYIELESRQIEHLSSILWPHPPSEADPESAFYDYKPLRHSPMLIAEDGRASTVDGIFITEKSIVGPLFYVVGKRPNLANPLFEALGKAVERYVLSILSGIFADGSLFKKPQGKNENRQSVEIADFWLSMGEASIFGEIKAVWLKEERILGKDPDDLIKLLREKYGTSFNEEGEEIFKGAAQLGRSISSLAEKKVAPDNTELNMTKIIYPVLIAFDPLLDCPGYGYFLNREFMDSLKPDSIEGELLVKGQFVVAPLIVLTLDDLEMIEQGLIEKEITIANVIADYSSQCPDRLTSFHNFLTQTKYKQNLIYSKRLAKQAHAEVLELQKLYTPLTK